jgi:hypothetical protein
MGRQAISTGMMLWLLTAAVSCTPKDDAEDDGGPASERDAGDDAGDGAGESGNGAGGTGGSSARAGTGGQSGSRAGAGGEAAGAGDGASGSGGAAGSGAGTGGTAGGTSNPGSDGLQFNVSTASDPVAPGARLLFTIRVSNVSERAVDGVSVLMRVPAGLQFSYTVDAEPNTTCGNALCSENREATWALGTIAAGTSRTITVNNLVLASVAAGTSIATTLRLTATGMNPVELIKTVTVQPSPAIRLALGTAKDQFETNETFNYDIDVGQIGGAAVTGAELRLSLPSGLTVQTISDGGSSASAGEVVWPLGDIPVGLSLHRSLTVSVDSAARAGVALAARAVLTYAGGSAGDAATEHVVTVIDAPSPIAVDFTATGYPILPNGRLLYRAVVSNVSARAVDGVTVLLRTPAGLQFSYTADADPDTTCGNALCAEHSEAAWNLGTLPAGSSRSITVNATGVSTVLASGSLISALLEIGRTNAPAVRAWKTVAVRADATAKVNIGSAANPVTPGQAFVLNVDVGNIGAGALQGATLRATLPAGLAISAVSDGGSQPAAGQVQWDIGTLAIGASLHRTIDVTASGSLGAGTILEANAVLSDNSGLPGAFAEQAISVVAAALPLTLQWSAAPNPVVPGDRLVYTATINNASGRAIDGVNVLWRVPAGMQFSYTQDAEPDTTCGNALCSENREAVWTLGTLASGMSQIISINALVVANVLVGTPLTATLRLNATGFDAPIEIQTTVPAQP